MCRLSQNVPAKPPIGTMGLKDNLADYADSGGLVSMIKCRSMISRNMEIVVKPPIFFANYSKLAWKLGANLYTNTLSL